ncbi:hypothetical protein MMC19_001196 [Ptychographa xylographoides]|nr:hypothetical protein [Ptychographa xylographoides]
MLSSPPGSTRWMSVLTTPSGTRENHTHYWGNDPSVLIKSACPLTFSVGNGQSIYESALLRALEAADEEVLFVTCFWAHSASLSALSQSLLRLSDKALSRGNGSKIRVRLGFSSHSLVQKLFHTSSPDGHIYPSSKWQSALGLPPQEQLRGLEMQVKSKFFRPFSVMHPKFMIVDRQRGFMPSCNVSWESWLECCLSFDGPLVSNLVEFWAHFWGRKDLPAFSVSEVTPTLIGNEERPQDDLLTQFAPLPHNIALPSSPLPAIILPSPHHSSSYLSLSHFVPLLPSPLTPSTPLNVLLLHLFTTATTSIKILTPNLTCSPVINALLSALSRGVDVSIVTNRRMMLLEQLVTAGTITEFCVWKMVKKYKQLLVRQQRTRRMTYEEEGLMAEEGRVRRGLGRLKIGYYHPRDTRGSGEPLKSHVKCTVVDAGAVVLGSGNMDRASWFTSQELGIALYGREVVKRIWGTLEKGLEGRVEEYLV